MIYREYCTIDEENGKPGKIEFHYPENFNFAYDVVDRIAKSDPEKKALVWCNTEGDERILSFSDISRMSIRYAHVLLDNGIGRGDRVIVALRRHYQYWPLAVALHRIGAVMIPVTHMLTSSDYAYRLSGARSLAQSYGQ